MIGLLALFNLYLFPTGRRRHALGEILARAIELGLAAIAERARRSLEDEKLIRAGERRRRPEMRNSYGGDAPGLDNQLDRCISSFDSYLEVQIESFPPEHARHQAAVRVRKAAFPQGVIAVTGTTFVDQHGEVNDLLDRLDQDDMAGDLAALPDAAALIDNIRAVNVAYGQSLRDYVRAPSGVELKAMRNRGQENLLGTMIMILAHFIDAPADDPERAYMLEPILKQNEEIARERRRRRSPGDIVMGDDSDVPADDEPADDFDEPGDDSVDVPMTGHMDGESGPDQASL